MRPRRHDIGGSFVGAVLGGLIGGPMGAALGGALGTAANTQTPVPLDAAIRVELQRRGLALAELRRETQRSISVVFSSGPGRYWSIVAFTTPQPGWTGVEIDDALFDDAVAKIDQWAASHV